MAETRVENAERRMPRDKLRAVSQVERQHDELTYIAGLTDERRLPRVGKIRLGERRTKPGGKEYPAALDYFKFDDEILDAFPQIADAYADRKTGEIAPKELRLVFPVEDRAVIFPQSYKLYGSTRGLRCKGNGKRARRAFCAKCSEFQCDHKDAERVYSWIDCPCDLLKNGDCRPVGSLMVILPDITMGGVFQIDTSSRNSIVDINSGIEFIRALCGHVALIPLKLRLAPRQVRPGGNVLTVYTLQIVFDGNLDTVRKLRQSWSGPQAVPLIEAPHDEGDEIEPVLVPDGDVVDHQMKADPTPPKAESAKQASFDHEAPLPVSVDQTEDIQGVVQDGLGWTDDDLAVWLNKTFRAERLDQLTEPQADKALSILRDLKAKKEEG